MITAREIMTPGATYVEPEHTVLDAAQQMASDDFGAMPVCRDGQLIGMVTDRDLVVRVLSEGRDPASTTIGEVVEETEVVTIGADDPAEDAISAMKNHAVRRLPVIDGTELVGMVTQADIARALPDARVGDLVGAISEAPGNSA
ncbi:MAG: CBS domain-containing protein [Acidimicrobiales bacterium]|nr:CBS domain-containing protein [Acidimicrobiales bacterium]